jgi:hypothetical protein
MGNAAEVVGKRVVAVFLSKTLIFGKPLRGRKIGMEKYIAFHLAMRTMPV